MTFKYTDDAIKSKYIENYIKVMDREPDQQEMNKEVDAVADTYIIQLQSCIEDSDVKKITDYIRSLGLPYEINMFDHEQLRRYNHEYISLRAEQRRQRLYAHGWHFDLATCQWIIPDTKDTKPLGHLGQKVGDPVNIFPGPSSNFKNFDGTPVQLIKNMNVVNRALGLAPKLPPAVA